MRKITSLLMLLSLFVGTAWGQTSITDVSTLSNSKVYYLKSERGSLVYNDGNPNVLCSTKFYSSIGAESEEAKWAVYKYKEKYYFYSIAGGKFVGKNDAEAGRFPLGEASEIFIVNSAKTNYPFVFSTDNYGAINHFNNNNVPGVANWKGNDSTGGLRSLADAGSAHMIIEAGDLDEATQKLIEAKIDAVPVLAEVRSIISDAITVGKTDAYLDVTALSNALKSYETEASAGNLTKLQEALGDLKKDGVKGTVILSEGDKFRIKAVDSSRGYVVYSTIADQGSETTPILANASGKSWSPSLEAEGVYSEWAFIEYEGSRYLYNVQKKAFIKPVSGGITFEFTTAEPAIYQKEDKGECKWAVKFGSQYMECSPGFGLTLAVRQIGNANDQGSWFYLEKTAGKVAEATQKEMATFIENSEIPMWKENVLSILGYVGGYDKSLESAINAITNKAEKDGFVKNNSVIALSEGYYYVYGTGTGNNASWRLTYDGNKCYANALADGEALGAKYIWYFNPVEGEEGFKLKACNLDKYLALEAAKAGENYASGITSDYSNGHKFVFTSDGSGRFIIKNGNNDILRTEGNGAVNIWNTESNESWYLVPAEAIDITLSATDSKGAWATTYLPFGVSLPEDLTAYSVSAAQGASATLEAHTSIPAGQGAILNGATAKTYTLTIKDNVDVWSSNELLGSNAQENVNVEAYVLSKPDTEVGLYKALMTDGSWLNNTNKAYLPASVVVAGSRFLNFDLGTETGIEDINGAENEAVNAVIYDLSGRRVQSAQKGIYIVNGKKVIK